jgi:hypothetical protein
MPKAEGLQNTPQEVIDWARNVGKRKTPARSVSVSLGNGRIIRTPRGADISTVPAEIIDQADALAREYAALSRDKEERLPLVKTDLISLTSDFPQISGAGRDPEHGNFNVTVVPQRQPVFDDERIYQTLGEKAILVYGPIMELTLKVKRLIDEKGHEISHERIQNVIRHALLGLGASEEDVDQLLTKTVLERLSDQRDNFALAKVIEEGTPVEGITFEIEHRIELDDIDKNKPISVRRPRRKHLVYTAKSNRKKLPTSSAASASTSA